MNDLHTRFKLTVEEWIQARIRQGWTDGAIAQEVKALAWLLHPGCTLIDLYPVAEELAELPT